MTTISDSFPAPALDPGRWTVTTAGTVGYVVGVPIDGFYPQNVGDPGDLVGVHSAGKLTAPGNSSFDVRIFYDDVFVDPDQAIYSLLGWRSNQLDGSGNSAFGIDLMLRVLPDPAWDYVVRTINLGSEQRNVLSPDPSGGGNSGFRIVRTGSDFELFYWDPDVSLWISLGFVTLPHNGPGYFIFGQFAEDVMLAIFPWVAQT